MLLHRKDLFASSSQHVQCSLSLFLLLEFNTKAKDFAEKRTEVTDLLLLLLSLSEAFET